MKSLKLQYQFNNDEQIQEYIQEMAYWITENSNASLQEVEALMVHDKEKIEKIFTPYSETAFHHDPSKFAEMFALHWNLIKEPEIIFV